MGKIIKCQYTLFGVYETVDEKGKVIKKNQVVDLKPVEPATDGLPSSINVTWKKDVDGSAVVWKEESGGFRTVYVCTDKDPAVCKFLAN